ncbi:MAG: 3-dehydroquinate synthase [Candidatus Eremiobacteraeota bacterium]|nr:3-dehydroquinate synthase [Candidatus Eremiobacteraeota bacterium]
MTRIDDLGYPIVVTSNAPAEIAAFSKEQGYRRVVVLCDRNVEAGARALAARLRGAAVLAFPLGERRKTMTTLTRVLNALASAGVERTTLILGVGGGVACDVFGFAAATYARGVPFAAVATSLVAMVDAAIGGKTGVNLSSGKNLAGVFRDPVAVFCDLPSLGRLHERWLREGLAEVVKHGIIEGGELFESLETLAPHPLRKWPWETVVADSIRVKAMVVADDRLERGAREVLNLGHTFGHAIERASRYRISHGHGLSIGLRAAGLLARRTGRFSRAEHLRVLSLLTLLRLPLVSPLSDARGIVRAMEHDKKRRNGRVRFVLPRALGDVEYGIDVPTRPVAAVLRAVSEPIHEREGR